MGTATNYKMLGLMSGTSGDGLDIAYCGFEYEDKWSYSLDRFETVPFPHPLAESLAIAHRLGGEELALLDLLFGKWMGQAARLFCGQHNLQPMAIASHGHTVFHQPRKGLSVQIGNGWGIHGESGLPVINDFRSLDLMLGGQGAPLVPVGDRLLFGNYDFCLNLGGIANISMEGREGRKAFDVSPFNLLLNRFANKKGLPFDENGALAKSGNLLPELLKELQNIAYYQEEGAKSMGRETIDQIYLPILDKYQYPAEDILATLVEHFSRQISDVVLNNSVDSKPARLLATGGGAFHQYFINRLAFYCGNQVRIIIPGDEIVNYKEALVFAFLGVLRLRKENNCLKSVTGASRDSCTGTVFGFF